MTDFQAVVLAGNSQASAARMYPLCDGRLPKVLLPVANRPLIAYQLEMLEQCGFTEAIVVFDQTNSDMLTSYLEGQYSGGLTLHRVTTDSEIGTAEAVLKARHLIKQDFVVLSGDLVVDPGFVQQMTDEHRVHNCSATVLLQERPANWKPDKNEAAEYIGCKELRPGLVHLVYYHTPQEDARELQVPKRLLHRFPHFAVHDDLLDAHFYVFDRWVLDVMSDLPPPHNVKNSLIPRLLDMQTWPEEELRDIVPTDPFAAARAMSATAGAESDHPVKCFGFVMERSRFCKRANTLQSYVELNNDVARGRSSYVPDGKEVPVSKRDSAFLAEDARIHEGANVGARCVVGEGTEVGDKCVVKNSIIGSACKIGQNVRLANAIVMDHVEVADGSQIQNCVLSTRSKVAASSLLTLCIVGHGYEVPEGTVEKGSATAWKIFHTPS
mmetsp:Transcript_18233/g.70475  ORF Transcript_18233/g.70475 Transcript_18233/m.70475 type:complete len:439 (+) Transcript_18233:2930-4246(+)